MPDELLTVQQAAERLNVPVRFIRRLVAERRIAFYKVGRYVRLRQSDLSAYVASGRVEVMTLPATTRGQRLPHGQPEPHARPMHKERARR